MLIKLVMLFLTTAASQSNASTISDFNIIRAPNTSNPVTIRTVGSISNGIKFFIVNEVAGQPHILNSTITSVKNIAITFTASPGEYSYSVYSKNVDRLSTHRISENVFLNIISMASISSRDFSAKHKYDHVPSTGDSIQDSLNCYVDFVIDRSDYQIKSVSPNCDSLE